MSYLVLARKWRPKRFSELVGQEHVVRALGNALDTGRVHHAFLFTGTRGVGKTTIARIFAKSLNCEKGVSAEPCGQCAACTDIDAGRYIDLLEIDAASNTGVDDVREVIENAQYMPSRGHYKVYLIDEVHMLSKAAFNALLKTLEEPPGHVKFLLATTDPQKLPVTVLSRCLQFNLKRLDEGQIEGQMTRILAAERIEADAGAIRQLARAADGSLRDGLSLLDQAIAYAGGALGEDTVRAMLGSVDRTQVAALLDALADGDGQALLGTVDALAGFAPDWGSVLEALAEALHRIQVKQLVPGAAREDEGIDVDAWAGRLRPEVTQLWYQMAVNGRRDLELAPAPRVGFEMSVLRMLAFRPEADVGPPAGPGAGAGSGVAATGGPPPRAASAMAPEAAAALPTAVESTPAAASPSRAQAPSPLPAGASDAPPWEVPAAVASSPARSAPRGPAGPADAAGPRAAVPPADPFAAGADMPMRAAAGNARPAAAEALQRGIVMPPSAAAVAAPPESSRPMAAPVASAPATIAVPSPVPGAVPPASAPGTTAVADAEDWLRCVAACDLKGPARELAAHTAFVGHVDGVLTLALDPGFEYLRSERSVAALAEAMAASLGAPPKIAIQTGAAQAPTLHQRQESERDSRQSAAEQAFLNDPGVKRLIEQHGARVVPDSIRPHDE
ncbi:DNA polymerase III subunit gamma/tau [Pseudoxanthomonas broegbernensis]|uniref:DNA polymerase III subunit gamma/tau n=1 Tax=Pseudoxanthomonas broegbernensis TaxID=83619 RepID=A0A7V8GP20_9GAMM|nr:DNA polymerase III subunit gamma/tau [Pseudoxanthomonas broegbernensis]KAF1687503.1 DNA polymerase III subunit gamma/tau [Pseudoxanthomonas broegbernensis]MBB6064507.1 DNA polymerase-3 subunit gamma/tau [Pseudoxanthomonas broegbernensis]